MLTKQDILNNITKNNSIRRSFLETNNITKEDAYDILYPEKIAYCKYCGKKCKFINFTEGYAKTCGNKECIKKLRQDIILNCITNNENVKQKRIKTCLERYGVCNTFQDLNLQKKIKDTLLNKYGKKAVVTKQSIEKAKKTNFEKYGGWYAQTEEFKKRQRNCNIKNHRWIKKYEIKSYKQYRRKVMYITLRQNLELLENYSKRGINSDKNSFHIDHIFSVYEGYRLKVPAKIIGDIVNLRMIPAKENISKRTRCDITLRELYERYYKKRYIKKHSHNKSIN